MAQTKHLAILILYGFSCFNNHAFAQQADTIALSPVNQARLSKVIIIVSVSYTLSMAGLYQVWYKDSGRQSFKVFNDNSEWKQVDKVGHFFTAFHLSNAASKTLQSCSVVKKKANVTGALAGFMMMLPIEIFDGFSTSYGASKGDLLANAGGSALFYTQQLVWNEIRIIPKFSFHFTSFARQRPDLLGERWYAQIVKDYNGQTYWLEFDLDKFIAFPKWLNLSIGYGAGNMVYARDRDNISNLNLYPYRQYYLSFDLDTREIKTRSKLIKKALSVFNLFKFPAPAIEFSRMGIRLHPVYF